MFLIIYIFFLIGVQAFEECPELLDHPNAYLLPKKCGRGLEDSLSSRIASGNTTAPGAYPWMALIESTKELSNGSTSKRKCAGTLINERYVLTAYSCFDFEGIDLRVKVWLRLYQEDQKEIINCNLTDCPPTPLDFDVEAVLYHPDYLNETLRDNLALVRLKEQVNYEEFVQPVCLPLWCRFRSFDFAGMVGLLLGWDHKGVERTGLWRNALEKSHMIVVTKDSCQDRWGKDLKVLDTMMCAGWPGSRAACEHDMGGPLLKENYLEDTSFHWVQIGIVYDGFCKYKDTHFDKPTVFTRLGSKNMLFILNNIKE